MRTHIFVKTFLLLLTVTVIFSAFSFGAFAASSDGMSSAADSTATETKEEAYENGAEPEGFFEGIYSAVNEHIGEILSALSFIGSLIIMICYKKGFLPTLANGVKELAGGVGKIDERANSIKEEANALIERVSDTLKAESATIEKIGDRLISLEEKLGKISDTASYEKRFETVLSAEIDMLYEIFMAAALPQYLKDSVGERIAQMKKTLSSEGKTDDEN